jgi:hypothetical protein
MIVHPYLGRICVMNDDGSNVHRLPQRPPGGRRIAFQR